MDADSMPTLKKGATGLLVARMQNVLSQGAPGQWETAPGAIDEKFGAKTKASVEAFQAWADLPVTGIVDERTWAASLGTLQSTLSDTVRIDQIREASGG